MCSSDLKAQRAVGGVAGGEARVELCVAAEEDSLEFAVDGRAMAATVVLQGWLHHSPTLSPVRQRGEEDDDWVTGSSISISVNNPLL